MLLLGENEMSSEKIRVGIIVAGGWAKYGHIPALQFLKEFEIAAVSSRKKELAEEYAASPVLVRLPWNLLIQKGHQNGPFAPSLVSMQSIQLFGKNGGDDETRTRDLYRDSYASALPGRAGD
jgi:hypothetical protein